MYRTLMTKDSGFRIRVQRELREKFLKICRDQDKPAAQVLREYMREYVAEHDAVNEDAEERKKPMSRETRKGSAK